MPDAHFRDLTAYVRFVPAKARGSDKRWRIAEVRVIDPTPDALRSLPLLRIERAANAGEAAVDLAAGIDTDPPADVPAFFRPRPKHWKRAERFKLERPRSRRLPDDFYIDVARAYTAAVADGLNPRKTLALDAGVPADTIARWTRQARRRGYLPPAEPGKATAGGPLTIGDLRAIPGVRVIETPAERRRDD